MASSADLDEIVPALGYTATGSPSYEFLLNFHLTNVEHINCCQSYEKQQDRQQLIGRVDDPPQLEDITSDTFKAYTGAHTILLVSLLHLFFILSAYKD